MQDEQISIEPVDLDGLLSLCGESVSRIRNDPDAAWERLLQRHDIDYDSVASKSYDEIQAIFGVKEELSSKHYGTRVSGSFLMGEESVLTRGQLDAMYDDIMQYNLPPV